MLTGDSYILRTIEHYAMRLMAAMNTVGLLLLWLLRLARAAAVMLSCCGTRVLA